jgi:hypothetical protein
VPNGGDPFQYAIVRVVPSLERGEAINAGVIVFCRARGYLAARTHLDREALLALAPNADAEAIELTLARIRAVADGDPAAGALARLPQSERYGWLAAPSSTTVQSSESHGGICEDPPVILEHLFARLVSRPVAN